MNDRKPIIELKNVSVCYGQGKTNEIHALKEIDLNIYEGEYIVFFGPSGCGKSTLLYTIAGLERATAGSVIVNNKNIREFDTEEMIDFYRTTIGMVFQAFYLVPHLSAKDNMMLSKMFSGVSPKEREGRADELMAKFGITPYSGRKPSMMSGGQQQRTAIARALMNDPEIILADEPVGNLDSKNSEIVLELLSEINKKEKKTVIQVTHNPKDIHYADRVFYMKDGMVERVVANTDAGKSIASGSKEMSEFEKLSEANPNLSSTQIYAKLMMRNLLLPFDLDTEQKIESVIARYIKNEISRSELVRYLDDPKEGAGLYSQKAKRVAELIDDSTREVEAIKEAKKNHVDQKDFEFSEAAIIRKQIGRASCRERV